VWKKKVNLPGGADPCPRAGRQRMLAVRPVRLMYFRGKPACIGIKHSMLSEAEPLIVHYHIFKNAGTSIDRLLAECFGDAWTAFEGVHGHDIIGAGRLRAFLAARGGIRAVSSHLARPPLPTSRSVPIVMLRHPIDRARSAYQFVRRVPTAFGHDEALLGFPNYVSWMLDEPGSDIVALNYQTIHLSEASFRSRHILDACAVRADIGEAQTFLRSCPAFGLVRDFTAACRLIEARYRPMFPELRLRPVHENASPDGAANEAESVQATREALGDRLFGRLVAANELDLELYDFACSRFADLCAGLPEPCGS
jgi:hypothetical protein